MNILDRIVEKKRVEVEQRKKHCPIYLLETKAFFQKPTYSLSNKLRDKDNHGIIAEFKRKSPSKGIINDSIGVEQVVLGYERNSVAGISVLTDNHFFGGSNEDLIKARNSVSTPILRKEFIVDEYQIVEAKSIGADAILLIAAVLSPQVIRQFAITAKSLGLEVLLEIHDAGDVDNCINDMIDIIGVNNRDLKTFNVDVNKSISIVNQIPSQFVKISESGISNSRIIMKLKEIGYDGFLIGECFMKTQNPQDACKNFIQNIHDDYK